MFLFMAALHALHLRMRRSWFPKVLACRIGATIDIVVTILPLKFPLLLLVQTTTEYTEEFLSV